MELLPVGAGGACPAQGWEKMCLQVLFLGPASPSTFALVSEKLVVSPVLRTLTLGRVLPYVRAFVADVCDAWPDIKGFLGCHYSGVVPATTRDFRQAFGFAFLEGSSGGPGSGDGSSPAEASGASPQVAGGTGGSGSGFAQGVLEALGLWEFVENLLRTPVAAAADKDVDPLALVPDEDFATLNSVYKFVEQYGLSESSKDGG